VAFESQATNLVPNDHNGAIDIFVRDRFREVTERINVSSAGSEAIAPPEGGLPGVAGEAPCINADGRFVAFVSISENLVPGIRTTQGMCLCGTG